MTESQTAADQRLPQQMEDTAATVLPKLEQFLAGLTADERDVLATILRAPAVEDTAGYWGDLPGGMTIDQLLRKYAEAHAFRMALLPLGMAPSPTARFTR